MLMGVMFVLMYICVYIRSMFTVVIIKFKLKKYVYI